MANLFLNNISKSFQNIDVLEKINISVNDGEFIVLVGPSGSGKSTILRIIAGLESPSSGQIEINNKIVNDLPPKHRDIAMVFQNYALYPHFNVFDNLAFPLKMKNINKNEIEKLVNETANLLGINQHLQKKPKDLSGGERQRVALGRAIIRKPQLFLMDEPLSNLDAKLRTQMRAELLRLHKTLATTVIYVTHDQIEALTMGDRIAVLDKGKIQQFGKPSDVYDSPENIFVAGFMGSPQMNFFDLKFTDNNNAIFLEKQINLSPDLIKTLDQSRLINQNLVVGIRPEKLVISNNNNFSFPTTVELIENLGGEHLIYVCPDNVFNKPQVSIRLLNGCKLNRGDKINLSFDFNSVLYFDKTTGIRVKA